MRQLSRRGEREAHVESERKKEREKKWRKTSTGRKHGIENGGGRINKTARGQPWNLKSKKGERKQGETLARGRKDVVPGRGFPQIPGSSLWSGPQAPVAGKTLAGPNTTTSHPLSNTGCYFKWPWPWPWPFSRCVALPAWQRGLPSMLLSPPETP